MNIVTQRPEFSTEVLLSKCIPASNPVAEFRNLIKYSDDEITAILEGLIDVDRNCNIKLRKEYQPQIIAALLNSGFGPAGARKIIAGCGAGKTIMTDAGIIISILRGKKKFVITGPNHALCRQLELAFLKLCTSFHRAYGLPPMLIMNVSSDGGKRRKDEHLKIDVTEEDEGEVRSVEQEMNDLAAGICAKRSTTLNHDEIKEAIISEMPVVFFVCKPSFLKTFRSIVVKNELSIDITCHDEFHNFISQDREDKTLAHLTAYAKHSHQNWFFSASKKRGVHFSWTHPIFGSLVGDIPTSKLVAWGYLVPNLTIVLVTAGSIKGISNTVSEYFKDIKIENAEKFYREVAVILAVIRDQLARREGSNTAPKILHFTSSVTFIKEMMKTEFDFVNIVRSLLKSIVVLDQINGGTPKAVRDQLLKECRDAAASAATLMMNHSVIKEGMDCPNFDVAILARGMSEIALQQSLGRIQRAFNGKTTAYLYIFVEGDGQDMAKLAAWLHYAIGDITPEIAGLVDEYIGSNVEDQKFPNRENLKHNVLNTKTDVVEFMLREEIEAMKAVNEEEEQIRIAGAMSRAERLIALQDAVRGQT